MKTLLVLLGILFSSLLYAQNSASVSSPDGKLSVNIAIKGEKAVYCITYEGQMFLEDSPLGLVTNAGDFTSGLFFVNKTMGQVDKQYIQAKIKQSHISYKANTIRYTMKNSDGQEISILFQVSNNDVAFRYELPVWGETRVCVVSEEATGFHFPESASTFLSPMMPPMSGFARSAPSYESGYTADSPMKDNTAEEGYVFPGLFRIGEYGWVLISETGVSSQYTASHLSKYNAGNIFKVEYPDIEQNNGFGSSGAQIGLPGITPWRTITIGKTLNPIVETTIPFDVVEPLYEPSQEYTFGKATWSWIVWQDSSMNYNDQVEYIDLAATLGFKYILIDAGWDMNIGYDRMKNLVGYARSKGVDVMLWYNSNGPYNDAAGTPLNKMNTSIERKKEMKWLKETGIKGLKVDFFGGDKQENMRLYEDILSDANYYGLMIIFHGTTLPRGWERMYPNFVGGEAVLASEMLVFIEDVRKKEAFYASLHPFMRNSVASMEFGGVFLNKYLNRQNKQGQERLTTDGFQLATSILFQNPVQMLALTPNNLTDAAEFKLEFLKEVPTTWDTTVFIDGYPGKYCVLARRHEGNWYLAGVNAEENAKQLQLNLLMLAGETVTLYNDDKNKNTYTEQIKIPKTGNIKIVVQSKGGFVIKSTK